MSDGYEVYNTIATVRGAIHLGCWAHARRYFVEAEAAIPKAARGPESLATQFISAIGELYVIEAKTKDLSVEQRGQQRQQFSKPVLTKIEGLLIQHLHGVTPGSLLGKALHYLSSQWPKLSRFVENGAWPIDNNLCENAIRPFVVGRRNWLFCKGSFNLVYPCRLKSPKIVSTYNQVDTYDGEQESFISTIGRGAAERWPLSV